MTMDKTPSEQDKTQTPEDATPKVDETTPASEETTPKETPQTYDQQAVDKLIQQARMEGGRDFKALGAERDELRTRLSNVDLSLKELRDDKEKLQNELDELARDDPDKLKLVQKMKALDEQEKSLKADRQTLETDKQAHGERIKLAEDTLREISIWEIAAEYETGDPVKLKDLCDTFTATSEEQIRKVADTLWTKKPTEPEPPETPSITPDSGITSGEGTDFGTVSFQPGAPSAKDMISKGLSKKK